MDKYSFDKNRGDRRDNRAGRQIGRDDSLSQPETGVIVAPDPNGGWVVQTKDGGLVYGIVSQTNRGLGVGSVVTLSRSNRVAYGDSRPTKSGGLAESAGSFGTGTGSTGGGIGGSTSGGGGGGTGGSPSTPGDGSTPRYRPNENGECEAFYYTGPTKEGDYDDPGECAGEQENSKSYYCENGTCYATAPGSGNYNSMEDCEAAVVDPGFTGGQSAGIAYVCTIQYDEMGCSGGNALVAGAGAVSGTLIGPVKFVSNTLYIDPCGSAHNGGSKFEGAGGGAIMLSAGSINPLKITNKSVTRADGLPDTGGDPPKTCG